MFSYIKKCKIKDYDFVLIFLLMAITIIGILSLGSVDQADQTKQIYGFVAGMVVMVVISLMDYTFVLKFWYLIYALNIILLALVNFMGEETFGAQRWITIAGIRFQPSESAKILLILFFAQFIMFFRERINKFYVVVLATMLIGLPLLLIIKQPDLSTTIVIFLIFLTMLFVGNISYKYVFSFLGISIPSFVIVFAMILNGHPFIMKFIKEYQRTRILAWLHPEDYATEEAYQQLNSIMAIGSGMLTGKGLNNNVVNSVKNGNFISQPQTDFIYTIVGEELGFIGASAVILLLLCICLRCIYIAYKAKDIQGKVIASGMAALVGFQSLINISVNVGLLPNTGLPLPFVSYGLTSLLSLYAGMGFVLNVGLQRPKKYAN